MNNQESGFTLLELLIVASLVGILGIVVSSFFADRLVDYNRTYTRLILQSNTNLAAQTVANEVRYGRSLQASNLNPDNNAPGAPSNLYSWASNNSTLVLATPAKDTGGNIIYADGLHTQVKTDDSIYYLSNNILYHRIIANSDPSNVAKTTCPLASASPSCPADPQVIENIAAINLVYYDTAGNVIVSPPGAYSVKIELQESKTVFNHTYSNTVTAQATLRNK